MALPPWRKALGRARSLPPRQLLLLGARRARHAVRAHVEELAAQLGGLGGGSDRLPAFVPGARDLAGAVELIEQSAGSAPVAGSKLPELMQELERRLPGFEAALLARADRACDGMWEILGYPAQKLGVRPDWQRDFVSGQRWDPARPSRRQPIVRGGGSDIKIPWEISRLQHLPAVAHAFLLSRDPRYLQLVCDQLEDWIDRNPPGRGVNWVGPMEVALRAVSMSWAWELCRTDARIPLALRAKVYWSLFVHGHFLRGHLEDGGSFVGNHYVANLLGLIWIGHFYPALAGAADWREEGVRLLVRHLPRQIASDGGDREASLAYHRLVAEMIGLAAGLTRAPQLEEAFLRMVDFTRAVLKPDGTAPQLGDNDGGRAFRLLDRAPLDHRYLLAWGGTLRSSLEHPLDPEAVLLTGRLPTADAPAIAAPPVTELTASRLTVLQRERFYVLLSAAPVGQDGVGGHGHNDKLSFELFLDGDVVVDPGSFCYTSDPGLRNAFRGTAAHATLQVDGLEQNRLTDDLFHLPERARARVLRVGLEGTRKGDDPPAQGLAVTGDWEGVAPPAQGLAATGDWWVWVAEHDGFQPLVHRRTVRVNLATHQLTIQDEVRDRRGRAPTHTLTSRLPLAPGVTARIEDQGFSISRAGSHGGEAILRVSAPRSARLSVREGWYSPDYGARVRCQILEASVTGELPQRLELDLVVPQLPSRGG